MLIEGLLVKATVKTGTQSTIIISQLGGINEN